MSSVVDLYCRFFVKVKSAKPTIDTTAPKTYGHLALKMKKQKVIKDL